MPTKEEVGKRLKLARFRHGMTLKQVAAKSGMSATHISEIERGRTSPTIGALQRIARALGERPAHFVEERDLCTVSLVRKGERTTEFLSDVRERTVTVERLTGDCPWSAVRIVRKLSVPGESYERRPTVGEAVIVCIDGMFRITTGDEQFVLREGDTIQFSLGKGYTIENIGDENGELIAVGAYAGRPCW